MRCRSLCGFLAMALVGCGDDGDPTVDGGGDAGVDGATGVSPPEIPWLEDGVPPIALTPCPDGWREVSADGVTTCDPYPEGGRSECGVGEAHFVGEVGCRPVGDPCPSGEFSDALPSDELTVVFVKAGATGGDGSRAAPFGALAEVPWGVRGRGWTVALAKGTYPGVLPLRAGVTVVGACAAETIVTGDPAGTDAVVRMTSDGEAAMVKNVAIVSPGIRGAMIRAGQALTLEGVSISGATELAVVAIGDRAQLTLTDVAITDTRAGSDGSLGRAINLESGARLDATRVVAADNRDAALFAYGAGTVATLTDSVLAGTQPAGAGIGVGVDLETGAQLEASRVLLSHNRAIGLFTTGAGASATLTDVVVRGAGVRGINVQDGAHLAATRLVATDNRDVAVFVFGVDASATLTDAVVRNTQSDPSGVGGRAFSIEEGGRLEATRLVASANRDLGLYAGGGGVAVTLNDVAIRDTAPVEALGTYGRGLNLQDGTVFDAHRLVVTGSHETAIYVGGIETNATFTDTVLRDVRAREADATFGYGITLERGAQVTATRLRIANVVEFGLLSIQGSHFEGQDVEIAQVAASACDCADRMFGHGAAVASGAIALSRFAIRDAATCGLFVDSAPDTEASLDVVSGLVEGAAIGACVQSEGFDLGGLNREVVFRDNEQNLQSTTLPVPDPLAGVTP